MTEYPRKFFYQDKNVAETYFDKRFTSAKGQRQHKGLESALELALAGLPGIRQVLDLPCGTGRFTSFLTEKGYRYVGVDVSKEMLDVLARDQGLDKQTAALVRCDGEYLPFKNNAFDCVVSIRLFQLIPPDAKLAILYEMMRVSKKWFITEVMHVESLRRFPRLKCMLRSMFAHRTSLYDLDDGILEAGWREVSRVRVKNSKHWVGVYQKEGNSY